MVRNFTRMGGKLIDTAPSYGNAEPVVGNLVAQAGNRNQLFLATKVGRGRQGVQAGRAEMEQSLKQLKVDKVDLMQVHNLGGVNEMLPVLREWKETGKTRYIGVTTTSENQYPELERLLRTQRMDFIQVDYAIDNREVEQRILPLAQERGVAVLTALPFGRGRVFEAFGTQPVPAWAQELGIRTWAQFALKYIVSHPAVTVAIPGTAKMEYLRDDLGVARGPCRTPRRAARWPPWSTPERGRNPELRQPHRPLIAMTAILQRFTQIRREEVAPVLASALSFFFILTALMVLRPAREALGMQRGIEAVRWLVVGTAVVTLAVNPLFGLLVSRTRRVVFITATYLFFAASLLVFHALLVMAPAAVGETSGMVFFVWFSVFNLFATMVFWALMADRFALEQSKRLFGVISVGGTLGAIAGPWLASRLAEPLGTAGLLPVS
ncbi:MAG TPA: aldo/keto reductase, partial [Longimicrobiaceae bacterium]|nr:aldo/keto reductase [Longimicrobiaceae bacterium]